MLALILTDAAFGVVSRVVPQLNVFAVGFPAKVVVGLLLVGASLPFVAGWISGELQQDVGSALQAIRGRLTMAGEKTEKATPKRRNEARKKGQVARSTDLSGAVVLLAGLGALGAAGPKIVQRMADVLRGAIAQISSPDVVSRHGIGTLMSSAGEAVLLAVAPIALACVMAGWSRTSRRSASGPRPRRSSPIPSA